jgi:hypothetical protein
MEQIKISDYDWSVTDCIARPYKLVNSERTLMETCRFVLAHEFSTNAPNGVHKGSDFGEPYEAVHVVDTIEIRKVINETESKNLNDLGRKTFYFLPYQQPVAEVETRSTVEQVINDRFYKTIKEALGYISPVKHRIDYMTSVTGLDSQNIMKALNACGFDDVATLRIHKLMFHAEQLSKSNIIEDLKKLRVDVACARHQEAQLSTIIASKDAEIETKQQLYLDRLKSENERLRNELEDCKTTLYRINILEYFDAKDYEFEVSKIIREALKKYPDIETILSKKYGWDADLDI